MLHLGKKTWRKQKIMGKVILPSKEIKRLYDFVVQYSLAYSDYFKN